VNKLNDGYETPIQWSSNVNWDIARNLKHIYEHETEVEGLQKEQMIGSCNDDDLSSSCSF
jgi:hypothetical protein